MNGGSYNVPDQYSVSRDEESTYVQNVKVGGCVDRETRGLEVWW